MMLCGPFKGCAMRSILVMSYARTALRHMPQDAARIDEVGDSKPPGLNCRLFRFLHFESGRKMQADDVPPPCVEIIHHQLHHAVFSPLLLIAPLQKEPA